MPADDHNTMNGLCDKYDEMEGLLEDIAEWSHRHNVEMSDPAVISGNDLTDWIVLMMRCRKLLGKK